MKNSYITFRSVTYAQRGEALLRRGGIPVLLQRTPKWMEEMGCGYCLNVAQQDLERAVKLLRSQQVNFRKVYLRREDGRTEEKTL